MAADWRPTASREALRLRAWLYSRLRAFFEQRGVLEVETPVLSRAGNTDPNIASFATRFGGRQAHWLRTSPEFAMKRLLAAGVGDCYELGRVFRDGEAGRRHNPEFTLLEWYRVGWDHFRLMRELAELVATVLPGLRVESIGYRDLFGSRLGLDPFTADIDALRAPLAEFSIDPAGLTRDDWLDLLMTHRLQPDFSAHQLLFVYDYPASQCALARVRGTGEDAVAQRFEAYLGAQELANGYHELADATEQAERFDRDVATRMARGSEIPSVDQALLAALRHGLPDCAGVALGIDRLLMKMSDTDDIADVLGFPSSRA